MVFKGVPVSFAVMRIPDCPVLHSSFLFIVFFFYKNIKLFRSEA